jgi:hypothetical protein
MSRTFHHFRHPGTALPDWRAYVLGERLSVSALQQPRARAAASKALPVSGKNPESV